ERRREQAHEANSSSAGRRRPGSNQPTEHCSLPLRRVVDTLHPFATLFTSWARMQRDPRLNLYVLMLLALIQVLVGIRHAVGAIDVIRLDRKSDHQSPEPYRQA